MLRTGAVARASSALIFALQAFQRLLVVFNRRQAWRLWPNATLAHRRVQDD
ncbi:hypothetical protein ACU4HD_47910 [Cupriavidus basilensis]